MSRIVELERAAGGMAEAGRLAGLRTGLLEAREIMDAHMHGRALAEAIERRIAELSATPTILSEDLKGGEMTASDTRCPRTRPIKSSMHHDRGPGAATGASGEGR